ncbi:hypothetical protein ACFZAR_38355 [Streptomyces sp. NPDC008222]
MPARLAEQAAAVLGGLDLLVDNAGDAGGAPGSAAVMGISSDIALVGLPYEPACAGVKTGLARVDEALRRELHGTRIYVATAAAPGRRR